MPKGSRIRVARRSQGRDLPLSVRSRETGKPQPKKAAKIRQSNLLNVIIDTVDVSAEKMEKRAESNAPFTPKKASRQAAAIKRAKASNVIKKRKTYTW